REWGVVSEVETAARGKCSAGMGCASRRPRVCTMIASTCMVGTTSSRRRSRSWPGRSGRTSSSRLTGFARSWRAPWWGRAIPLDWNSGPMHENATNGYDLIIVGGGPAGLCAAMYAGRGMLKAVTIERGAPGGELLNTDLIEDYIGFESIKGWDLAQKMSEHAKKFGAEIVTDTVERVRKAEDGWFDVATSRGVLYRAPAVILTAGGTPVKLAVPGEQEYAAKGVSYW